MNTEFTFKDVCESIKKQGKNDPELIEAVDNLLGFTLICSYSVIGTKAAALLPILAVKNELTRIGKSIFDKITKKKDADYLVRYETMRNAYGLLVFTSFFEALDSCIPDDIRKEINQIDLKKSLSNIENANKNSCNGSIEETYYINTSTEYLEFPHPSQMFTEQCPEKVKIWEQMSLGFQKFIQNLPFWENLDEEKRKILFNKNISKEAAIYFEAQYFELVRKFEDFAVWSNLHEHNNAKTLINELSDYVKQHSLLSEANKRNIDVGFMKLHDAILNIPETVRVEQAAEIAESFRKYYEARIHDPIINDPTVEDKNQGDDNAPRLSFPKVCDAFVPQAFRLLRQGRTSRRFEDEGAWEALPRRNDLGPFLLSYLTSPYSTETPLLILGHPGSGKSLLTTILSAQLMAKQFTAIRVPLREVNADVDIQTQIEEFIKRVSGVSIDSWFKLGSLFKDCPPIIILDGYDELLQASGQVFASYIMDAQRFQQHQAEQGCPVRIIITSRITLIDKARVPIGTTIIRLLEFDRHQRERWIEIWNKANLNYFKETKTEEFTLPSEDETGAENILNLAEQPLLLLMLAIYDSQDNQLRDSEGLDRTKLYDSLLRRFVIRERDKEKSFSDADSRDRESALTREMQRLGVASLGMYNRRKVHILSEELNNDLAFFDLEKDVVSKSEKALSQADLLLGSFFFVHKSKVLHGSGADNTQKESSAFEFLHNTFGEFLVADFIIRRAVAEVKKLRAAEENEDLRSMLEETLTTADGFRRDWFASLVYTPLFTRPVILQMIREWTPHVLTSLSLKENDFIETLDKIVLNQIKRVLNKREMPQIMQKDIVQERYRVPFESHPLVGHIAIYSINLVLLRLVAGKTPFIFDETHIASHEDGTRPWDRLVHLWRSWFSLANLNGMTALMEANRNGSTIQITASNRFQAQETKGMLDELYNVAVALGDDISAGMAGTYLFDHERDSLEVLSRLEERLSSEGLDLGVAASVNKLLALAKQFQKMPDQFIQYARHTLELAVQSARRDQVQMICTIISRTIKHFLTPQHVNYRHLQTLFEPWLVAGVATLDPRSAITILRLSDNFTHYSWAHDFINHFVDRIGKNIFELGRDDYSPLDWLECLELMSSMYNLFRGVKNSIYYNKWRMTMDDLYFNIKYAHQIDERNLGKILVYLCAIQKLVDRNLLKMINEWEKSRGNYDLKDESRKKFFDHLVDPQIVWKLNEGAPEGALVYLRALQELFDRKYFKSVVKRHMPVVDFFDRLVNPRHLLELSERNPERALTYIQILKDLGGSHCFETILKRHKLPEEFFDRLADLRHLLVLNERNPQGALAKLQILRELGVSRYFETIADRYKLPSELLDRLPEPSDTVNMHSLAVWLFFARLLNCNSLNSKLVQAIIDCSSSQPAFKSRISFLPIASLKDLRWLADESGSTKLQELIAEMLT